MTSDTCGSFRASERCDGSDSEEFDSLVEETLVHARAVLEAVLCQNQADSCLRELTIDIQLGL